MANNKTQPNNKGFALLLTLLVVAVLVSIGLSVLSLTIKQVRLASNARDSEAAFHAANAGLECAVYWRRQEADDMENGRSIGPIRCFKEPSSQNVTPSTIINTTNAKAFRYQYQFQWGDPVRCTQIDTIVGSSSLSGTGLTIPDVRTYIEGYPSDSSNNARKECEPGTRCSIISVRGYNKACSLINSYGTVQREVLLEL